MIVGIDGPVSIALSIVSHGHGAQVLQLLALLSQSTGDWISRVWITLNTDEPELAQALARSAENWQGRLDVRLICNDKPQGFGTNHNRAFLQDRLQPTPAPYFVVMNPDVSWSQEPWPAMLQAASQEGVGGVYPCQVDPQGRPQDHARRVPTPKALLCRYLGSASDRQRPSATPDWANAALLLFRREAYERLQGFDESYHMYCEDVDICLRLQLAGYRLIEAPGASVVHEASRASRRELRHLGWHLRSLLRLWHSPAYRQYLGRHEQHSG